MPVAHLSDRGVVRVAGEDAAKLLQGLVTADLDGIAPGEARFAGLLTPQGKILFDFFVVNTADAMLLECPRALAADLAKRLTFYRLRAKADITDVSTDHAVLAAWQGGAPPSDTATYADPRHANLGTRTIAMRGHATADATEAAYDAHRIGLGVPEGGKDYAYGDTFPHEALYDRIHGVSFEKGCYVGQEIVSRMQHRGTARKRILPVTAASTLPAPGTPVTAGEATIGTLGSSAGARGLALLRVDRVLEARTAATPIGTADAVVDVDVPDWAVPKGPAP